MAGHYVIAGKKVPFHILSIGFISAYAIAGTAYAMKPKPAQPATPPIKASSSDEEAFIKQFLAEAEAGEKL
ncbi:ATP synthase subunit K ATP19 [Phycomyces blakesleeanus]|uniref:ATP synthase subunit K ATP19 n=2 Tax=Phycomyces blakesleeanus TaxID=4837 RepID=A0A167N6P8_PHYB8|nr:ATP synthase subunit K ATP19 [Phycomyces blakesleeanus NRRL 1555(-)]KAI9022804.1 hypothetical protein CLU79DRAFT_750814 [Phycomyces nitens]OAD75154.1 ATP synthase subunit K ATP19 [Phycomyces blakesleeanus NRRL 1555(-)]|eukprot:XP_018293194.1 ATP synthase subunit K ATP19 [Phycomyces blakesleeanus NRRL 1555(-)]